MDLPRRLARVICVSERRLRIFRIWPARRHPPSLMGHPPHLQRTWLLFGPSIPDGP